MTRKQLKSVNLKKSITHHLYKRCLKNIYHEEICQEYLDEGEVFHLFLPLTHEDGKISSFNDTNYLVENPSNMVDQHIDYFIHVGRRRWDVVCFTFDKDPI